MPTETTDSEPRTVLPLSERMEKLADAASLAANILLQGATDIRECEVARKLAEENYKMQRSNTIAFLHEKMVLAEVIQWIIDFGVPAVIEAKARKALKDVNCA